MMNLLQMIWRVGWAFIGLVFTGVLFGQLFVLAFGGEQAYRGLFGSPVAMVVVGLGFWVALIIGVRLWEWMERP